VGFRRDDAQGVVSAAASVLFDTTIWARRNCNIGDHSFIETGAPIGDQVTIKNQAMVWEGVEIGDDVFVGPASVLPTISGRAVGECRCRRSPPVNKPGPDGSREPASVTARRSERGT
jgi:hypothetical protein